MNNKGQSLTAFILIIPIILLVLGLVVDIGLMGIEKRNLSNTLEDVIEYGLKNKDENKIKELLYKNIKEEDINKLNIKIDDNITIDIEVKYDGIFNKIIDSIDLKYVGYIENNKIKIIKR